MRWIFRAIGALVLTAIGLLALLFLLPSERIAQIAADQFQAATGRELRIEGKVSPRLWPELGVTTGRVVLANADWATDGPMVTAEGISIGVDPIALFGGDIAIRNVELISPDIRLERRRDGTANWQFSSGSGSGGTANSPATTRAFGLDQASISNGSLRFIDAAGGQNLTLTAINGTVNLPSLQGAVTLDLGAMMQGQAVRLKGRADSFAALAAGAPTGIAADLGIGGSRIGFDGSLATTSMAAKGRLDAEITDLAAVFGLIGQRAPALPPGLGAKSVAIAGQLDFSPDRLTLNDATLRLDQNALTGSILLGLAGKPRIEANLKAEALDLSGAMAGGGGPSGPGWSKSTIDASGLGAVDGTVTLTAAAIDLGLARLGATDLTTVIDNARAVTTIRQLQAFGGDSSGQVILNARKGLSARVEMAGNSLSMQSLLGEFLGFDRLNTTGDVAINVLASGNSMDALMRSLDGTGSLTFGKGELLGLDVVGMLRTMNPAYRGEGAKTVFNAITAAFSMTGGVMNNPDLLLDAPLFKAGGKGDIGFGDRVLNYTLTPVLYRSDDGTKDLSVPITISGSWSDPKIGLDMQALAGLRLDEELARLKTTGEAALRARLEQELGISMMDGETVEDALRRGFAARAETKMGDVLGPNLGGLLAAGAAGGILGGILGAGTKSDATPVATETGAKQAVDTATPVAETDVIEVAPADTPAVELPPAEVPAVAVPPVDAPPVETATDETPVQVAPEQPAIAPGSLVAETPNPVANVAPDPVAEDAPEPVPVDAPNPIASDAPTQDVAAPDDPAVDAPVLETPVEVQPETAPTAPPEAKKKKKADKTDQATGQKSGKKARQAAEAPASPTDPVAQPTVEPVPETAPEIAPETAPVSAPDPAPEPPSAIAEQPAAAAGPEQPAACPELPDAETVLPCILPDGTTLTDLAELPQPSQ